MSLSEAIFSRLSTYVGIAERIGTRSYPDRLPQNPILPANVFQVISTEKIHAGGADLAITRSRVQVDSYGLTYDESRYLGQQVRGALQRYRGTEGTTEVRASFLDSNEDMSMDETGIWRTSQDFMVWTEPA